MALTVSGSTPTAITYNGNDLTEVKYNGTTVWEKPPEFSDLGSLGFDVDCTMYPTIWGVVVHGYRSTAANGETGRHHEFWLIKRDSDGNWDDMVLMYTTSRPYVQVIYEPNQLNGRAFGILEYGAEGGQADYTNLEESIASVEWSESTANTRIAADTTYNSKGYTSVFDLRTGDRADSNYTLEERTTSGIMLQSWMFDFAGWIEATPDYSLSYAQFYKQNSGIQNAIAITIAYNTVLDTLEVAVKEFDISGSITDNVLSAHITRYGTESYDKTYILPDSSDTFEYALSKFWRVQKTDYRGTMYYPHMQLGEWTFGYSLEPNTPAKLQAIRFGKSAGSRTSYNFTCVETSVVLDSYASYTLSNVYCKKRPDTISIWDPSGYPSDTIVQGCDLLSYDYRGVEKPLHSSSSTRYYTDNTEPTALPLHKDAKGIFVEAYNGALRILRYVVDSTGAAPTNASHVSVYTKNITGLTAASFITSTSALRMHTYGDYSDMVFGDIFNVAGAETSYYEANSNKRYYGKYQEFYVYSLDTQHLYWIKSRV